MRLCTFDGIGAINQIQFFFLFIPELTNTKLTHQVSTSTDNPDQCQLPKRFRAKWIWSNQGRKEYDYNNNNV